MTNVSLVRAIQAPFLKENLPEIKTGNEVEISFIIKEWNKERIQKFTGLVIKTAGKSALEKTITVRRKVGTFWVERVVALHSPSVASIKVNKIFKVRRKNIGFIRKLTGNAAKLKEIK